MSATTLVFESIVGAGLTPDKQHFILHLKDGVGNEAKIAMPVSNLDAFAKIGFEMHARYKRDMRTAIASDSEKIKF